MSEWGPVNVDIPPHLVCVCLHLNKRDGLASLIDEPKWSVFSPSAFSPLIKGILRNQEVFLKRAQSTPPSS